ncbi:COX15/CtaA family protein [Parafrankia discariae]|uniref:COX15/CtaA family protein n=1 Tax=Parafrankia discariae TaxID=365528 RepID=UPI00039E9412|nr:COX15/CtaA family protein [Parafrankia discariae]
MTAMPTSTDRRSKPRESGASRPDTAAGPAGRLPVIGLRAFRRLTLASVLLLAAIVVTGGAVRLTGSGLGCPTWPQCGDGSFTPHSAYALNGAIEFGNRVISIVVGLVVLALPLAARRLREPRRDLLLLSLGLWLGFVGQAVLGGITVLVKLHPATVAAHFLLSMVLLFNAVALHRRARQGAGPTPPAVRPELLWLARLLMTVAGGVLVLGTVVTGTGPHSGDSAETKRFGFDIVNVAQLHADGAMILTGLTIAMIFAVRLTSAPAEARRSANALALTVVAQAAIGFTQYFAGIPPLLVALHMAGATLMWIVTVQLWLAMSERPAAGENAWTGTHQLATD